jgi:DNA-binding FadR family transcriptional regulator
VVELLRNRIVLGEYTEKLPAERKLCEELDASRWCVRLALERLGSEGLLLPVAGKRWRVLDLRADSGFELLTNSMSALGHNGFVARVHELLDFRAKHFVAAVDAMVHEKIEPSEEAGTALMRFGVGNRRVHADEVLADEDLAMLQLVSSQATFAETLAAHQIRRALAIVRSHFKLDFFLFHLAARFQPLHEAIRWRDRSRARLFAEDVANARNQLYLMLAREAVEPGEPVKARFIFGEN